MTKKWEQRKAWPRQVPSDAFRHAARERLNDARCLHDEGRFDGAVYLCGYAVECSLKFALCKKRGEPSLELSEAKQLGHKLLELLDRTELRKELLQNKDLWRAFESINNQWSPELRYGIGKRSNSKSSEIFLRDTLALRSWLWTRLGQ